MEQPGVLVAAHIGHTALGLLRPGAAFTLRAVFRRAAHAVAECGSLLVLTGEDVAAPWALGVPVLPVSRLAGQPRVRLTVSPEDPTHLSMVDLTIDLGGARIWPGPPPGGHRPTTPLCAAPLLGALPLTAPGLAGQGAEPLLDQLTYALSSGDPTAITAACAPLVGLGRGLTPAGDDLVTGVLGVAVLAGLPCLAPPLNGRTTLLGATQIAHAAAGALIEPLHAVIVALLAGAPAPPVELGCTLSLGTSSGADMLAGARLALVALRLGTLERSV